MGCLVSAEGFPTDENGNFIKRKRDISEYWSDSDLESSEVAEASDGAKKNDSKPSGKSATVEVEDDTKVVKAKKRSTKGSKKSSKSKKGVVAKEEACSLLLIGSPQTGKSTFLKQLQLNFTVGFSEEYDAQRTLAHNLVLAYRDIIDYLDDKDLKLPKQVVDEAVAFHKKLDLKDISKITKEMVAPSKALWSEPAVQNVWNQRESINTFLIFNLDYIMEHIERLAEPEPKMTTEDMLRARQRTMASSKLEITYENEPYQFYDIGGQRTSRRQWSQMVENPRAIVFFVALSDYDVPVFDGSKMKLEDSLEVFEEITRYPEFQNAVFVLMLNKFDVFETKLKTRPLKQVYPDWDDVTDAKAACKAISKKFCNRMPENLRSSFNFDVICALETDQVKKVFLSLREFVTKGAHKEATKEATKDHKEGHKEGHKDKESHKETEGETETSEI